MLRKFLCKDFFKFGKDIFNDIAYQIDESGDSVEDIRRFRNLKTNEECKYWINDIPHEESKQWNINQSDMNERNKNHNFEDHSKNDDSNMNLFKSRNVEVKGFRDKYYDYKKATNKLLWKYHLFATNRSIDFSSQSKIDSFINFEAECPINQTEGQKTEREEIVCLDESDDIPIEVDMIEIILPSTL